MDNEKELLELREQVAWFAQHMERELRENDHKAGWEHCGLLWLHAKMTESMGEAAHGLVEIHSDGGQIGNLRERWSGDYIKSIISECVDVANYAMMIADRLDQLRFGRR